MSNVVSSISAAAFSVWDSPVPRLLQSTGTRQTANEERLVKYRGVYSPMMISLLSATATHISPRRSVSPRQFFLSLRPQILFSPCRPSRSFGASFGTLKIVYDEERDSEMIGTPRPFCDIIQSLITDEKSQQSPVDPIPVTLLKRYQEFKTGQKLWGEYIQYGGEAETSSPIDSASGFPGEPYIERAAGFLRITGSAPPATDVYTALAAEVCCGDALVTIKSAGQVTEQPDATSSVKFDVMVELMNGAESSCETALCERGSQKLLTCYPR